MNQSLKSKSDRANRSLNEASASRLASVPADHSDRTRKRRGAPKKPVPRPLRESVAFKAAIYAKGWSIAGLAKHWEISREWLLKLAADEQRPRHYDDAVAGLPRIGPPITLRAAWSAKLDGRELPAKIHVPGLRYRNYLFVGAIVVALKDVGSLAEEGMRGYVVHVHQRDNHESYRILFETGAIEVFNPELVDEYIQDVGLQSRAALPYRYIDDSTVLEHFEAGHFDFY